LLKENWLTTTLLLAYLVIVLSIFFQIPQLFTLTVIICSLILFHTILQAKSYNPLVAILGILTICLWLRVFPYTFSIPLGVDPIRDVIYAYHVIQEGTLIYNMPRFVSYYQYFPATQIIPAINAVVSGLDVAYSHYLTLSVLLSLGIIPLIITLRNIVGAYTKQFLIVGILYATIPAIATWGYWVIPMSFSMLLSAFSIMLFAKYFRSRKLGFMVLSLVFSILTVMVHAVVGAILIGFYIITLIMYYLSYRKGMTLRYSSLKHFVTYDTILTTYTVFYWYFIDFTNLLLKQMNRMYVNMVQFLSKLFKPSIEGTRSVVIPTTPKVEKVIEYPQVVKYLPTQYPLFCIFPRWVWSTLLILIPILLFLICKVWKIKVNTFLKSLGMYAILMLMFTVFSLYFNLIWKADRYIASPTTIYAIVFITALLASIIKHRLNVKVKYLVVFLVITLVIASILDPRVSFYTNPIEGDRVTFKINERTASNFLILMHDSGYIVSDYNLMTMYLYYLITKNNRLDLNIAFSPIYHCLGKKRWNKDWVFLLRKYSIESYYIWDLNFKRNPKILNKAFYLANLVYVNGGSFIFKSITMKE